MDSLVIPSDSSEDILGALSSDDGELFEKKPAEQQAVVSTAAVATEECVVIKEGKRRRKRDRKISISADHSNSIAGVKVREVTTILY